MRNKILFIAPGSASEGAYRAKALRDACAAECEEAVLLLIESDNGNSLFRVKEKDYIWHKPKGDQFYLENTVDKAATAGFISFLNAMQPDVVHIQLDAGLELDLLQIVRVTLPAARIIVTLQFFDPVCPSGWLLMPSGINCPAPLFSHCGTCCPDFDASALWQRARRHKHYLELADAIITPTGWLQKIYMKWGLPAEKLYLIPNFIGPIFQLDVKGSSHARFGFVGEAAHHTGLHVFLEALGNIPKAVRKKASFHIYAHNLERQSPDYIKAIEAKIVYHGAESAITWTNTFLAPEVERVMSTFDWLVLPHIGASSSPLALDAAIALRKPVICAKGGGIASRVGDYPTQLRHEAGSASGLATNLATAIENKILWDKARNLLPLAARNEILKAHLRLMNIGEDALTQESW